MMTTSVFMCLVSAAAEIPAATTTCPWSVASATGDGGNAASTSRGYFLDAVEVDLRAPIVEEGTQFRVLGIPQIALRLDDKEVRRQADVEPALLRLEALLGQLSRRDCRLQALAVRLHQQRRIRDFGGDLELELRAPAGARGSTPPAAPHS